VSFDTRGSLSKISYTGYASLYHHIVSYVYFMLSLFS